MQITTDPLEQGIYTDGHTKRFKVVAVGIRHGKEIFVVKIEEELCVFQRAFWHQLFKTPQLIYLDPHPGSMHLGNGRYYGHHHYVKKNSRGEIEFLRRSANE